MRLLGNLLIGSMLVAGAAMAHDPAGNPFIADIKAFYDNGKGNILKAAEKMPEEHYSFAPTPEVRTFGRMVAHVADANFNICGRAGKVERPAGGPVEKTKTSKADLVAALKASFDACDSVYASLSDATAAEKVKFFNGERTKLGILSFHSSHAYEHYGNLVTYLRMKGLVPPSSEGR